MLEFKKLVKNYGKKRALDINDLFVQKGECVGILGNNGAGKTTLFRSILDLVKPDTGTVSFQGFEIQGSDHWKGHISAFLDEASLIDFLTPTEYFNFVGSTFKMNQRDVEERLKKYDFFLNEDIRSNQKLIRELSTGSKVRTGIVSTLLHPVELIILDEPFAHIDPRSQQQLIQLIKSVNADGVTVLLSSHSLSNVADLCKRLILMHEGTILIDQFSDEEVLQKVSKYFSEDTV